MFPAYFTSLQSLLLYSGGLLLLASLLTFRLDKTRVSVTLLVLGSFSLFCFAALLDPFVNLWDERFHALVAKNLMGHPLKPTLYDEMVITTLYDHWDKFHVWLHKQPLFMWQIALSFKLFGVSEFTLRLPGAVMLAFTVFAIYRSGRLLVSPTAGLIGAFLAATSFHLAGLVSGRVQLDQNDAAFVGYVSLSIWSFCEYYFSRQRRWIILAGLFSGGAILCKWLTGLLIYACWGTLALLSADRLREFKNMGMALLATLLVAAPWQIYTLIVFPEAASLEMEYNSRHFTEVIEGHGGDWTWHFEMFPKIYGNIAPWLIFPALFSFSALIRDRKLLLPFLMMPVFTYIFFTLAATKMPSFTIIALLPVYVIIGSLGAWLFNQLDRLPAPRLLHHILIVIGLMVLGAFNLNPQELKKRHEPSEENLHSRYMIQNRETFKSLDLPPGTVVFNLRSRQYIDLMFYNDFIAYNFLPFPEQLEELKAKGRPAAVFVREDVPMPDYLLDGSVILIEETLMPTD